jgi:hypothetical protein
MNLPIEYPSYRAGDHAVTTDSDPYFATYDEALSWARQQADLRKDDGSCGAAYGVWLYEDNIMPTLVSLVTYEGIFVLHDWTEHAI